MDHQSFTPFIQVINYPNNGVRFSSIEAIRALQKSDIAEMKYFWISR